MTNEERIQRARKALGPDRPSYFGETDVDRVMAILLALMSEVAALRDRLDTHEQIASQGTLPSGAAVEAYQPAPAVVEAREAWRDSFIRRLFRVITEDLESLRQKTEKPA
jgi:hypothetical protein